MSEFLGVIPGRVFGPSTLYSDVAKFLKEDLTGAGWQALDSDLNSKPAKLYFVPPASEKIGSDWVREVVLFEVGDTSIDIRPLAQALKPLPQSCYFKPNAAGSSLYEATIGGAKVSQDKATLKTTNTALDNLRYFFEALGASKDAVIVDWDWFFHYQPPQNAEETSCIFGIRKTAAENVEISQLSNVSGGKLGSYTPAGYQKGEQGILTPPVRLAIDLINGFIYFLQINKRGIALATRTNVGYSGPCHACYGDHDDAVNALPDSGKWKPFLSPIELLIGTDEGQSSLRSWAGTAKLVGISAELKAEHWAKSENQTSQNFSGFLPPDAFIDVTFTNGVNHSLELLPSGCFKKPEIANDFQIHRMGMAGHISMETYSTNNSNYGPMQVICPCVRFNDWYKFIGTATDENLQFCSDSIPITKLKTEMDRFTDYATLDFESTSGMPQRGIVIIENEAIEYTGINGNSLTGCKRAKYATKQAMHFKDSLVYMGLWFIKINGGCILAGYQKP